MYVVPPDGLRLAGKSEKLVETLDSIFNAIAVQHASSQEHYIYNLHLWVIIEKII